MNFLRLIPYICKSLHENKKFYLNTKNKNKSLKFTHISDLINFIENKIERSQIKTSYKKIKYHNLFP